MGAPRRHDGKTHGGNSAKASKQAGAHALAPNKSKGNQRTSRKAAPYWAHSYVHLFFENCPRAKRNCTTPHRKEKRRQITEEFSAAREERDLASAATLSRLLGAAGLGVANRSFRALPSSTPRAEEWGVFVSLPP